MLRESMHCSGQQLDVRSVTQGFGEQAEVPHAAALTEFAEAVVLRDSARSAASRARLRALLGADGLVDAAATVAAHASFLRPAGQGSALVIASSPPPSERRPMPCQ